jgi:hypothetical protein
MLGVAAHVARLVAAATAREGASKAIRRAKNATGAVRQAVSEASSAARSTADSVAQAATRAPALVKNAAGVAGKAALEASEIAKTAADSVRQATAGASTIANSVVHTVSKISSPEGKGWLQKNEISDDRPDRPSLFLPQRASNLSARRRVSVFIGFWFAALSIILLIWLHNAYLTGDVVGTLEAFILTAALFAASSWLYREVRAWRHLAVAQELQRDLSDECRTAFDEVRFRAALRKLRRAAREPALIEFIDGADLNSDTAVLRQQLDSVGLRRVDANAVEAIRRSARDAFFLSLISTNVLIETAAFSVRALGMIRRIAGAYGHRPGRIGTLRLTRHILADIALLPIGTMLFPEAVRGAGSTAAHHLARGATATGNHAMSTGHPHVALVGGFLGLVGGTVASVAEGLTPRVADAALAAGRMGHLGLLTVAHVRPMPLSEPRYRRMRWAVLRTIGGLRRDAAHKKKELRP